MATCVMVFELSARKSARPHLLHQPILQRSIGEDACWMTQAAHVDPNEGRSLIREAVRFLAIPCGLDEFPRGLQREYQDQSDEAWIGFR